MQSKCTETGVTLSHTHTHRLVSVCLSSTHCQWCRSRCCSWSISSSSSRSPSVGVGEKEKGGQVRRCSLRINTHTPAFFWGVGVVKKGGADGANLSGPPASRNQAAQSNIGALEILSKAPLLLSGLSGNTHPVLAHPLNFIYLDP